MSFDKPIEGHIEYSELADNDSLLQKLGHGLSKIADQAGRLGNKLREELAGTAPIIIGALTTNNDAHLLYHPQSDDFEITYTPVLHIPSDITPTVETVGQLIQQHFNPPTPKIMATLKSIQYITAAQYTRVLPRFSLTANRSRPL